MKRFLIIILFAVLFGSCTKEDYNIYPQITKYNKEYYFSEVDLDDPLTYSDYIILATDITEKRVIDENTIEINIDNYINTNKEVKLFSCVIYFHKDKLNLEIDKLIDLKNCETCEPFYGERQDFSKYRALRYEFPVSSECCILSLTQIDKLIEILTNKYE